MRATTLSGLAVRLLASVFMAAMLLTMMPAGPAFGQAGSLSPSNASSPTAPADAKSESRDPLGRDTPKGTVLGFMKAAGEGDHERAARYLDARNIRGQVDERVRQLQVVLNHGLLPRDLERLSDAPQGAPDEDLPPNVQRVGVVSSGSATVEILLDQMDRSGRTPVWRFSATTLDGVPAVYEAIGPTWIDGLLWAPLREIRLLEVPLWQWLGIPLSVALILAAAGLLSRLVLAVLSPVLFWLTGERAVIRTARLKAPIRVAALSVAMFAMIAAAHLPLIARFNLTRVAIALAIVAVAWLLLRLTDVVTVLVEARLKRLNDPGGITVAQLVGRLVKAFVILVAVPALLYVAGVDLTTTLAGVGIGGIAIAFAAQKTVENLLGGITIISDQPVRVGDVCKIDDVRGTVESIGLRSTQIRTIDRTVVSVPNARMASENLENFGLRDKIIFRPTLMLRYETRADQLRYVLAEIRRMFYEHPKVENDSARIRFVRLGGSSLDLEAFAYVLESEYSKFLEVQEDLLLRIVDIVEASGTGFAFPSSTTYIARDAGLDEDKTQSAMATVGRWREENQLPFPNFHPGRISEFENRIDYPPSWSDTRRPDPRK